MNIDLEEITPSRDAVFESQGIKPGAQISAIIQSLYDEALRSFAELASPVALVHDVSKEMFADIYTGEGDNDKDSIVSNIFPRADHLRLFALTIGAEISARIESLFRENEYAVGYMLDSVASIAADRASELLEEKYLRELSRENLVGTDEYVLGYSPGYCGWHISGQKKLFTFLQPEKIGISLNESYLMTPLKSVSGVLIAGQKEIHLFTPKYPFCKSCTTHSCVPRMKALEAG